MTDRSILGGPAFRYLVAGGIGYLVNLAVLSGCTRLLDWNAYLAVAIAYIANTASNYWLNRVWTFGSHANDIGGELRRFSVVALILLVLNFATFHVFYSVFGLPEEIAQTISILIGVPVGFTINQRWTFVRQNGT